MGTCSCYTSSLKSSFTEILFDSVARPLLGVCISYVRQLQGAANTWERR